MRVEGLDAAVESLQRDSANHIRPLAQTLCLNKAPNGVSTHELRTIEQRQSLFGLEADRLPPELLPYVGSDASFALIIHLPHANKR